MGFVWFWKENSSSLFPRRKENILYFIEGTPLTKNFVRIGSDPIWIRVSKIIYITFEAIILVWAGGNVKNASKRL